MNWDFIYRGETKEIDDSVRASAGGSFARLSSGYTHFELSGPEGGEPIVLVHGFSVPYFIFDPTFEFLVQNGFRVLRYDLFGRGLSDRPHVPYNVELFVNQLADLLNELHIDSAILIGLSMGGAIATSFTARFPRRVRKLVLIDPIGTEPMQLSWIYKAAALPVVSEIILGLLGTEKMVQNIASDFFDPSHVERFKNQYREQMQYRGFKRAILSTVRNRILNGVPNAYQQLGRQAIPVLLFWGRNDVTLPFEQSTGILAVVPQIEFHPIEDCGHIPHYEKPNLVNPYLLDFLNR